MDEKANKQFEKAVANTIELYEILRGMKIRDHTGEWLQFLHWPRNMDGKQKQARTLMDNITQIITSNNLQISKRIVHDRVIYNLLQLAIWYTKDYQDFPLEARKELQILFEYDASRIIDVPLVYLVAEKSPLKFGLISITNVNEEDRTQKWWDRISASGGKEYSVRAYARVESRGDLQISIENATEIVNDMIIFLRAIGFPITADTKNQFGLLNEYSTLIIPYRIGKPRENHKIEYPVGLSTKAAMLNSYEVQKDILDKISAQNLEKLQKLIANEYFEQSTELKRKFFLGLRWLGEATKPDMINARFIKLSFSLESFIGGEIKDVRKTKTTLAKRCAIIAGKSYKEQQKLYNAFLRYYDYRSEIVHGTTIKN